MNNIHLGYYGQAGGHYDKDGRWIRTKFCFISCGDRCDCMPRGPFTLPVADQGVTHYEGCWIDGGPQHADCEAAQRGLPKHHSPEWWDMMWKKHEAWREGNYPAVAGTGFEVTPPTGVSLAD